jgi:hypothetical protein
MRPAGVLRVEPSRFVGERQGCQYTGRGSVHRCGCRRADQRMGLVVGAAAIVGCACCRSCQVLIRSGPAYFEYIVCIILSEHGSQQTSCSSMVTLLVTLRSAAKSCGWHELRRHETQSSSHPNLLNSAAKDIHSRRLVSLIYLLAIALHDPLHACSNCISM